MSEDPRNIRKPKDPRDFIGHYVKLAFQCEMGARDFLWVLVERLGTHGTELEGVLVNDPIHNVGYQCGEGVGFDVDEIIEVDGTMSSLKNLITHSHVVVGLLRGGDTTQTLAKLIAAAADPEKRGALLRALDGLEQNLRALELAVRRGN